MLRLVFRLVFSNLLGNLWVLLKNLFRLPAIPGRPRWVTIPLKEPLPERPRRAVTLLSRKTTPSVEGLSRLCEDLARDPRLEGVVFRLEELHGGWARLAAVRSVLERLRESGKRVVVHSATTTS